MADDDHWVDRSLRDWDPRTVRRDVAALKAQHGGSLPGMGGMGGMGGPGNMLGMSEDELGKLKFFMGWVMFVIEWGGYAAMAAIGYYVLRFAYFAGTTHGPTAARQAKKSLKQRRAPFERAAMLALASVCVPVMVAQVGLVAGPLLPPALGWKLYVYGSFASGAIATVLGGLALARQNVGSPARAIICMAAGLVVLGLWYLAVHGTHHDDPGLPPCNDVATDVDDPPLFNALADATHGVGYPRRLVPLMRAHYDELLAPKLTTLPIGAAFIRALSIAQDAHWRLVTNLTFTDGTRDGSAGGYLEPSEWMDKDEVFFEATSTTSLFRIPDEVAVRVRHHTFDDGYVGARVDFRSRGHLVNDRGSNAARLRKFLAHEHW